MDVAAFLVNATRGGLGNLAAYLAAHVLLCLLPAFYIAGAMTALIPKESVTRFLGRDTRRAVSYPAAALAGGLLAVYSRTIVPLFAGIYKKGAHRPLITFRFFPCANILALVYTGSVIGVDLALARLFLSLAFGIGIGLIMALLFRADDAAHDAATSQMFAAQSDKGMSRTALIFLLTWVALLLVGTLKLDIFTGSYIYVNLPLAGAQEFQALLDRLVPFEAGKGEEGVSLQGVLLILLLAAIGLASWRGFERIHDGFSAWTRAAIGLIGVTLLVAAVNMQATLAGLRVGFTGKFFGVLFALAVLFEIGRVYLTEDELRDWLWESWRFVKQIFPLLVVGVFLVGVIRVLIRPEWIESLAGSNTLLGNLTGVAFGVFMYFPTLVEVPIAQLFLSLGMHRGPLLAYLMADPELSLQSILILSAIIGKLKTWTYVVWVALFSTMAGLIYGAWVDGMSLGLVAIYLGLFLTLLALALGLVSQRNHQQDDKQAQTL